MRVLVTGGSGAIGSHLVEALVRQGHEVHCLLRRPISRTWLADLPVKSIQGDLTQPESLLAAPFQNALIGAEVAFHLAGRVKGGGFGAVNAAGATALAEAIRRSLAAGGRLRRLVFVSSLAAMGPNVGNQPLTSDSRVRPVSLYGRSKLAAEKILGRLNPEVETAILRPGVVYGPRDKEFLTAIRSVAKTGLMTAPDPGQMLSFLYVDDMVDILLRAGLGEYVGPQACLISDDRAYTTRWIGRIMARRLARSVRLVSIPGWLVYGAALVVGGIGLAAGRPVIFGLDKAREVTQAHWWCQAGPDLRKLGYSPQIDLEQGLELTIKWYKAHKWL